MTLQIVNQTKHFIVRYDDSVGAAALAVANAVLRICEGDLLTLSVYMPYSRGGAGDPFVDPPIDVQIVNDPLNGPGFGEANNNGQFPGHQSRIRINPFSAANVQITDDFAGFLFVAEMSELLMGFYGWDGGSSQGEALSRVMAEDLHPASSFNFVNTWLSWPRPRPDWISRNEPASGPVVRGDFDPIAYGCGIIFIYYLRYQLNISYDRICMAGGSLLSDRYQKLTGATDDPADVVNKLLDHHFGTGRLNLVGNNPFPLFDGADRKVSLSFSRPISKNFLLPDSGVAHVRPFFTCPVADYPYTEYGSNVSQSITAATIGIGIPTFQWRVNGQLLSPPNGFGESVTSSVDIPDPQNPEHPSHQQKTFTFDYKISSSFDASGGSSTLTITSRSLDGDYRLDLEVDADETAVPTGPVTEKPSIQIGPTRTIVYGGTYDADRKRCEEAFKKAVGEKLRFVQDALSRIHNLPDPPPGYLVDILESANLIREELARLGQSDHTMANRLAHYVSIKLGVPARLFLIGARGN
jgi:hypothetical protein